MGVTLIASPQRSPSSGLNSLQTPSNRAGGSCFEVTQRRRVLLGFCAYPTQAVSLDVSGMASINVPTPITVTTNLLCCCVVVLISPRTYTDCISSLTTPPGHFSGRNTHILRQFPLNIWQLQSTPLSPNEDQLSGGFRPKGRGQQGEGDVWHGVIEQARKHGLQQGGWQSQSHPDPHPFQCEEDWAL